MVKRRFFSLKFNYFLLEGDTPFFLLRVLKVVENSQLQWIYVMTSKVKLESYKSGSNYTVCLTSQPSNQIKAE